MIAGLSTALPGTLFRGLTSHGVPAAVGSSIAHQPPVSLLFAALLGYNPLRTLLGPVLPTLPPAGASYLTGSTFFPNLISGPFMGGIHLTFTFSLLMMLIAAGASWLRGGGYVYREPAVEAAERVPAPWRPMVAISAAYGTAGGEVGRAVADTLGTPFVDRAIPGAPAGRLAGQDGGSPVEGREATGLALMLEELGDGWPPFGPIVPADGHAADADIRARLERGIRALAGSTGAVILSHGAAAALRERPDALRIRLHGPLEARLRRAMAVEALDEAGARRRLEAADRAHQAYLRRLYGEDPTNPDLYHLVIDSTALPLEACTDLIVRAASRLPLRRQHLTLPPGDV
jgi:cytidylate kinase